MTDNGRSADPRKSSKVPTISTECRDFRRESVVCVLRVRGGVLAGRPRRSRFTVSLAASAHRAAAQAAEVAEGRGGSVRICARRVAACERQHTQVSRPPDTSHVTLTVTAGSRKRIIVVLRRRVQRGTSQSDISRKCLFDLHATVRSANESSETDARNLFSSLYNGS